MYRRATRRTRRGNRRTTPIQEAKSGVKKSQNSSQKVLSDVPTEWYHAGDVLKEHPNEVPEREVDSSSPGSSPGRESPLARGLMAEFYPEVYRKRRRMGLRNRETRELPSSKRHCTSSKVRDEGEEVPKLQDRRPSVAEEQEDEERSILRACSKIDAGREKFRRARLVIPGNDSQQPAEAREVQEVPCKEGKEGYESRFGRMGSIRYTSFTSGFSSIGPLAELKPLWEEEALQTETIVAPWGVQSWQDYTSGEIDEILSSLYGSDGQQES